MNPRRSPLLLLALGTLWGCSADYHAKKGKAALDAHDLAGAESHYRSALEKDPNSGDALSGLGWTYQIAGQRDAARTAFSHCLELLPTEVSCLRGMASVVSAEGNTAAAQELLTKASQLAPDDPAVQASQALLDLARGDLAAAEKQYTDLLARFPTQAEYQLGLGEVRLRQKRPAESLDIVSKGLVAEDLEPRLRAMFLQLRARALVESTVGVVNPKDCAGTAGPVLAWLDAADAALAEAAKTGVALPDADRVKGVVTRRRGAVEDRCPGTKASGDVSSPLPPPVPVIVPTKPVPAAGATPVAPAPAATATPAKTKP